MLGVAPVVLPQSFVQQNAPAQLDPQTLQPVVQCPDPSMTWGDAATVLSLLASVSSLLRS
jgi:hypothetical protein